MAEQPAASGKKLESWKEIAAYLRRDVRTVRRWEKSEGLPVHRHLHQKLASVYAFSEELDEWARRRHPANGNGAGASRSWYWIPITAATLVGLAVTAAFWLRSSTHSPAAPDIARTIRGRLLAAGTGEGQAPRLIRAGVNPIKAVLIADGNELLVIDQDSKAAHVVSVATSQAVRSSRLSGAPMDMEVSNGIAFIVTREGELLKLDPQNGAIKVLASGLAGVRDLVLTDDGRKLYALGPFAGLKVLDTASEELHDVPTVRCPMYATVAPGKELLYVSHQCGGPRAERGADVIDIRSTVTDQGAGTLVPDPHVGGHIAASPDGNQVWLSSDDVCIAEHYDHSKCPITPGALIRVYRTDDRELLATLPYPALSSDDKPSLFSFTPDSKRVLAGGQRVRVFDTARLRVVEEADLNSSSTAAFSADGKRMYIAAHTPPGVAVFETAEPCMDRPAALISWWPGDGNAEDVSDGNSGELRNGARVAPAWSGQGFHFDGHDDFVFISKLSNVQITGDFSVAFWVKPSRQNALPAKGSSRGEPLLDHMPEQKGRGGWRLDRIADGRLRLCQAKNGGHLDQQQSCVESNGAITAGRWTHVAAVKAGGRLALYRDGALDSSSQGPEIEMSSHPEDLRLGADWTEKRFFAGMLDEVQFFNQAIAAEQVRRIFDAGRAGMCYR